MVEMAAFLSSGSHVIQKDCRPSSINTLVEALSRCQGSTIPFHPPLFKYLGKSHNLWHRMALTLEKLAVENQPGGPSGFQLKPKKETDEIFESDPPTVAYQVQI